MNRTLQIITKIVGKPSKAFTELKKDPTYFTICVIIAVVSVGIAWAVLPFLAQVAQTKLPIVDGLSFVWLLLVPFSLLIKWLIFAGILYIGVQLLESREVSEFKQMFAVVVHAELILVLSNLINAALLLSFKKIEEVQTYTDLQMIPGLHLLFGDHPLGILSFTFLSQINPFFIWYLIVLSRGVATVGNLNRKRAELLAVLVWLADFGFRTAIAVFF